MFEYKYFNESDQLVFDGYEENENLALHMAHVKICNLYEEIDPYYIFFIYDVDKNTYYVETYSVGLGYLKIIEC